MLAVTVLVYPKVEVYLTCHSPVRGHFLGLRIPVAFRLEKLFLLHLTKTTIIFVSVLGLFMLQSMLVLDLVSAVI